MKKFTFLAALAFLMLNAKAQNVAFEKVLDRKIAVHTHANSEAPYFIYEKFQGDKILRFEDEEVQLYDADFNLIWEKVLGNVKTSNGENYYTICTSENESYVFQRGFASFSKNIESRILRINSEGDIKSLELTGKLELSQAEALINCNDRIILIYSISDMGPGGYSPRFGLAAFDKNLTGIENNIELEFKDKSGDYRYRWVYFGLFEEKLVFKTYYSKNGETMSNEYQEGKFFEREVHVDSNLEIILDEERAFNEDYVPKSSIIYTVPPHYDTSKYAVRAANAPVGSQWYFPIFTNMKSAEISNKEGDLTNLVQEFYELKTGKKDVSNRYVMFYDVVDDPINNSINVIFHYENHPAFLLTLNENLKVVSYYEFRIGYTIYSGRPSISNLSFPFSSLKKGTTLVGEYPANHKINALDFAVTRKEGTFYTVINYPDYQLLISDNRTKATTTVFKIIP